MRVHKAGLKERCHLNHLKLFVPRDECRLVSHKLEGVYGIGREVRKELEIMKRKTVEEKEGSPEGFKAVGAEVHLFEVGSWTSGSRSP